MPNRLGGEKSPYLAQHADNPVDWMPWGPEAFERARAEDKPLLVSIGYSTCHWCHVMERESFSDAGVAALMNDGLVCVKVDREERPDVDAVYMAAVTALTGAGGWPLNCFVTPDGRPFYAGTYFPPRPAHGRPSWAQLVDAIVRAWRDPAQRPHVLKDAAGLAAALKDLERPGELPREPDARTLDACLPDYRRAYDPVHGGFSGAPKFPMPVLTRFLMRRAAGLAQAGRPTEAAEAADMALATLRKMAKGGIHDHLGGGFSRYSTDERWHVPHFEKMLYDNAQLAMAYVDAWRLSRDPEFAGVARGILGYLLRDLRAPEGAFYCAEDADSVPAGLGGELKEGAFYVWTRAEIDALLGPEADRFCSAYGVRAQGNVLDDPMGEFAGVNVLVDQRGTLAAEAGYGDVPAAGQEARLEASRRRLFEARQGRPRPRRDEKVLASWNGLAIAALAQAAAALDEPLWAEAAGRAADFLLARLWDPASGALKRRYAQGQAAVEGMADDYAFLAWGLLELHQATFEPARLEACAALVRAARDRFVDPADGRVFAGGAAGDPLLPARVKDAHDNVEPAAASVLVELGLRLDNLGAGAEFRALAELILRAHVADLERAPRSLAFLASALDRHLAGPERLVVAGGRDDPRTRDLLRLGADRWLPCLDRLWVEPGRPAPDAPSGHALRDGRPTAYLCREKVCLEGVTDAARLRDLLGVRD